MKIKAERNDSAVEKKHTCKLLHNLASNWQLESLDNNNTPNTQLKGIVEIDFSKGHAFTFTY